MIKGVRTLPNGEPETTRYPECYKKPFSYDGSSCSGCAYEMKCYNVFLAYISQNKRGVWG